MNQMDGIGNLECPIDLNANNIIIIFACTPLLFIHRTYGVADCRQVHKEMARRFASRFTKGVAHDHNIS